MAAAHPSIADQAATHFDTSTCDVPVGSDSPSDAPRHSAIAANQVGADVRQRVFLEAAVSTVGGRAVSRSKCSAESQAFVATHGRWTVIDLFAGAGGTGLGFREAGFSIRAAVERSPHAARTYSANLGVEVRPSDIADVCPRALRESVGMAPYELDVLVGCPPCQGFTRLRNAKGASDARNALVLRYLEFIAEFRPRFAVFENVPGLRRTTHGREFYAALLDGFASLDYAVGEHLVDAADFGVPQHRERAIVLAGRNGEIPPAIERTHGDPTGASVREHGLMPWVTVRDAVAHLPALAPGERSPGIPNHEAPRTGLGRTAAATRLREFIKLVPLDGGSRADVQRDFQLPCHLDHNGHSDVYGRLAWDQPANTITTGCTNPSKGRFVHPTQHRGLSLREAAALQSFPASFVFHGECVAEQIGNAVPPLLAEVIARALGTALQTAPRTGPTPSLVVVSLMQAGELGEDFAKS